MSDTMVDVIKGSLGIGIEGKWRALWGATFGYRSDAPCTYQSLGYRLDDWWGEYGPHWPQWDITVHEYHEEKAGTEDEYRFLFEHYQLPYRTAKMLERELPLVFSEFPLTVQRTFSWA